MSFLKFIFTYIIYNGKFLFLISYSVASLFAFLLLISCALFLTSKISKNFLIVLEFHKSFKFYFAVFNLNIYLLLYQPSTFLVWICFIHLLSLLCMHVLTLSSLTYHFHPASHIPHPKSLLASLGFDSRLLSLCVELEIVFQQSWKFLIFYNKCLIYKILKIKSGCDQPIVYYRTSFNLLHYLKLSLFSAIFCFILPWIISFHWIPSITY